LKQTWIKDTLNHGAGRAPRGARGFLISRLFLADYPRVFRQYRTSLLWAYNIKHEPSCQPKFWYHCPRGSGLLGSKQSETPVDEDIRKMKNSKPKETSNDYLKILEKAKKQYQQYVELGKLCDLLESMEKEQVEYVPPSPDNPLTTNKFRLP